jgi:hypothetical protein
MMPEYAEELLNMDEVRHGRGAPIDCAVQSPFRELWPRGPLGWSGHTCWESGSTRPRGRRKSLARRFWGTAEDIRCWLEQKMVVW